MDELTSDFLAEANESLEALDNDFIALEQDPSDMSIITNIFRVMHTIKGTCGFIGLTRLEKLAHAAENIMDKLRDGAFQATPDVISLILETNDQIKVIIEYLEENEVEPEGSDQKLIDRLNHCADTGGDVNENSSETTLPPAESTPPEAAPALKTPDLDEEIDFDPVPAPGATVASDPIPTADAAPKTPDLDEEIDFDPVPAPGAEINTSPPATTSPTEAEKKQAIQAGLAATQDGPTASTPSTAKKAPAQTIRVGLDLLQDLMEMVGELVLTRNQLLQLMRRLGSDNTFAHPLQRLNIITTELQEGVMKTRMQPIGNAWAKFPRVIRDLAKDLNKKINLEMVGAETDLDRQMLEAIKDPLTHMVRNSADHGIEMPETRVANGKQEAGTITLSAYHEGGHIIIKISDDGGGLNVDRIKAKAIENNLATETELESMPDKQIYQYILKPGFSTAEKVTSVSGRGVGMDVVVSNIEKIGGSLEVNSAPGKGSEFIIKLPLTLAIMPVLIIESAGQMFAIPQIRVSEIVRANQRESTSNRPEEEADFSIENLNGSPVLRLRGSLLPLVSLQDTLHLENIAPADNDNETPNAENDDPFIVVCELGSQKLGLVVDKVFHTEEIVVKPISPLLQELDVYAGCTILGDGSVIMILDPTGLMRRSGVKEGPGQEEDAGKRHLGQERGEMRFLVFRAGGNAPKAVPLDLVARLEEIDMADVEWSGETRVVQYRGGLMRLRMAHAHDDLPQEGVREVIVFNDGNRTMGLIVEEILDIVNERVQVKSSDDVPGLLGSLVINHKATDLIDISHFFSQTFGSWLGHSEAITLDEEGRSLHNHRNHLLLVDDSPFFRKFMEPVLLVADFDVTTAENGLDGLKKLRSAERPFDLIISDIDMPEMNGVEFTKTCKADPALQHLPVIALTSHEESDFKEPIKDIGFSAFVTKSDRDRLVKTIKDVLGEVSSGEEAA